MTFPDASPAIGASWAIGRLADAALRALVPAVLATLALRAFRVRHAFLRLAVWRGVLYAALALPALGLLLPVVSVRVPVRVSAKTATRAAAWLEEARGKLATVAALRSSSSFSSPSSSRAANPAALGSGASSTRRVLVHPASAAVPFDKRAALASGRTPVPALVPAPVPAPSGGPVQIAAAARIRAWRAGIGSLTAAEIALGVYALVLAFLLGRLTVGFVFSHRLRRTAHAIDDRSALRWLDWHALAMGVDRAPALAESTAVTVPLTLGVWRPAILLPADWREWEGTKLSAVIAHELSHVRRRDARTKTLALVNRSFFWFSPLSWWLEGHLAALSEQASDLAVIGAGAEPTYYAEVLMSFFGALQDNGARVCRQGVFMARGGRAHERIEKILSSTGTPHVPRKARLLVLLALVGAPLVCLTAMTRPVLVASPAAAPQLPAPPAALQLPAPPAPAAPLPPVVRWAAPAARVAPPAAPDQPIGPSAPIGPRVIGPVAPASPLPPPAPFSVMVHPAPMAHMAVAAPPAPAGPIGPTAPIGPTGPGAWAVPPVPARVPGWAAQSEPPEAPEPPQGGDDGDWRINNEHQGMTFAVVSGRSVMMNGSSDDADEVRALRSKIGADFIWFIHDGNSYVIRDAATVKNAQRLYAPMDELGRRQDELGRQQDALGQKQDELGKQQDTARVKVPADLEARLKKVEDEIHELGSTASQDDLGRLQGELGDLQGYLGDLQGKVGDEQGELGRKQGDLGAQQGELGRKQGELGQLQGELAREAAHKMQAVLKQALANGQAQRAPE
jgi:beta-lactamase regulating signal transducer with metallopeptidase domain